MTNSKRAVILAMDSEHSDRLVEIALEHIRLAKEILVERDYGIGPVVADSSRDILGARINQLRSERDSIIQQFEEE